MFAEPISRMFVDGVSGLAKTEGAAAQKSQTPIKLGKHSRKIKFSGLPKIIKQLCEHSF